MEKDKEARCKECGELLAFKYSETRDKWYCCDIMPDWIDDGGSKQKVYTMHFKTCKGKTQQRVQPSPIVPSRPSMPTTEDTVKDIDDLQF